MLHQNWFMNPRFEMFEDYGESQSFYDTETGIIYVVFEEYGMKGSTIIQEITEDSTEYKPNYERYKAFKGMTYNVKLVMSDEYTIEAHSKEEAEQMARDKFGCDYYIDDVETEITKPYDFWCNLSGDYKDLTCCDEWGAAILWLNDKQGVEYNFCIDGDCNSCAIYKMYYDEKTDTEGTDYSTFEHYEIDFDNANWKEELEKAMYKVAKKFFESEVE